MCVNQNLKRGKRTIGGVEKLSMGAIRMDDKKNTRRVVLLSLSPTTTPEHIT